MSQSTMKTFTTFDNWKYGLKYITKENFKSLLEEAWKDLKFTPHMVSMDFVDIHFLPRDVVELENHNWCHVLKANESGLPLECSDCQLCLSVQKEINKPWSVLIKTRYSDSIDCVSRQMTKACM